MLDGVAALIAPFEVASLDEMPATVCAVAPDHRIVYINPAWLAFAHANDAKDIEATCGLGVDVLRATPEVLRSFYEDLFARALRGGIPVEHEYECSSSTVSRSFRMGVHPCPSGALVIVHSLVRAAPHESATSAPLEAIYRNEQGLVVQCSHCRRVRRVGVRSAAAAWDWIPEFVVRMPARTSHSICDVCVAFYYP